MSNFEDIEEIYGESAMRERLGLDEDFDDTESMCSVSEYRPIHIQYHGNIAQDTITTTTVKAPKIIQPKQAAKASKSELMKKLMLSKIGIQYRREQHSGSVFERETSYYYKRSFENPLDFLNHIFKGVKLWELMSVKSDRDEICNFIKSVGCSAFPWIDIDHNYLGFSNGVYDLSKAAFLSGDDIPKGIQVRKMFDYEFEIKPTPLIDTFLGYQIDSEEDMNHVYFMLGRTLTKLTDRFDFMLMISGQAGSGKSLLLNLVKHSFSKSEIGILSNSLEKQFGLQQFVKKQIVVCGDMPRDIAKTLSQSDFLEMMACGPLSCPVKGGSPIEVEHWTIPTIINSNDMPNYKDTSGQIIRRIQILDFPNVVPESVQDTDLQSKILKSEFPSFIHRCRKTYLDYCIRYKGKAIAKWAPQTFKDNSEALRGEVNDSFKYAIHNLQYEQGSRVFMTEMRSHFKTFIKEHYHVSHTNSKLNPPDIVRLDSRISYTKQQICRTCKHLSKECKQSECQQYSIKNRILKEIFFEVSFKADDDE